MKQHLKIWAIAAAICLTLSNSVFAHFLWIVRAADSQANADRVHVYFSELAEPDDPDLLERFKEVTVWQVERDKAPRKFTVAKEDDSLTAVNEKPALDSLLVLHYDYGIVSRNNETFLLHYYAKTGPEAGAPAWQQTDCREWLALDLIPELTDAGVKVNVLWQGEPLEGSQVIVVGPNINDIEATTGEDGTIEFKPGGPGTYSIRARHMQAGEGARDGKAYSSVRHYSTLSLPLK
jgi:uncharacterized GH25 family protein